jgi:hypothetical protein
MIIIKFNENHSLNAVISRKKVIKIYCLLFWELNIWENKLKTPVFPKVWNNYEGKGNSIEKTNNLMAKNP